MMIRPFETRLRRIEAARSARAMPPPATAILPRLEPGEDAEPHIAARLKELGQRRDRTPIAVLRAADWPAHREGRVGGMTP